MLNFLTPAPSPAERQRWTTFYQQQLENRLHWAVELVGQHKELATPLRDHFGTLLMLLNRARSQPDLHSLSIELIGLLHPWPLRWEYWSEWEAQIRFAAQTAALLGQPVQQSEFLSDLADLLYLTGRAKEGLAEGERALNLARQQPAMVPLAKAGRIMVLIHRVLGKITEGKRLQDQLEQEVQRLSERGKTNPIAQAYLCQERMRFLRQEGKLKQAIALADDVLAQLATWREVDELLMTAVYHYRAVMHWMHGTLPSAIEDYDRVIAYHNQVGDTFAEMDASSDMALIYARMGRLTEAEAIWQRCIIVAERLNAGYILTQNVGTLIAVYMARGQLDEALANVERHLALATEMGLATHKQWGIANRGVVRLYLPEYRAALEDLQFAISFSKAKKREADIAVNLVHISYAYLGLGQLEQGLEAAEQAYHLGEKMDIGTLRLITRRCLACYRPAPEEKRLLEEALELARKHHYRIQEAACLLSLVSLASDESEKMDLWQEGTRILEELDATAWLKGCSPDKPPFIALMW